MSANRTNAYVASWAAVLLTIALLFAATATSHAQTPDASNSGGYGFELPDPGTAAQPTTSAPTTTGPAATIDAGGQAVAPAGAPKAVRQIIAAGNKIAFKKYIYGGGHRKWRDKGYDCSGSVSYALRGAKLLTAPLASGDFINWGDPGAGSWVTLYTKSSHIYMVVAGLRFDTSGRTSNTGTRWHTDQRSGKGYTVRHPIGL